MTRRRLTDAASWCELIVAAAVLWMLWPAWLGGGTSLIVVSGVSMEPTYHDGDVLIVHDMHAEPGDVIAFRVPGREGQIVHRVVERRSDGRLLVQGDNRETPDLPLPSDADVIGVAVVQIPFGKQLLRLATDPLVLGVGAGCWVIAHGIRRAMQQPPSGRAGPEPEVGRA